MHRTIRANKFRLNKFISQTPNHIIYYEPLHASNYIHVRTRKIFIHGKGITILYYLTFYSIWFLAFYFFCFQFVFFFCHGQFGLSKFLKCYNISMDVKWFWMMENSRKMSYKVTSVTAKYWTAQKQNKTATTIKMLLILWMGIFYCHCHGRPLSLFPSLFLAFTLSINCCWNSINYREKIFWHMFQCLLCNLFTLQDDSRSNWKA